MKIFKPVVLSVAVMVVGAIGLSGCDGGGNNPNNGGGYTDTTGGGGNDTTGTNTAHTHTWGDWVITTPETCDAAGVETRTCTQGDTSETRAISKLTGVACNPNMCGIDGTAGSCKTVVIGDQKWMAENLNMETTESWCYENSPDSCNKYGRLYTWDAAKTACPSDWHLPDRDEWGALTKAAGGTGTYGAAGGAGATLKSTSGWKSGSNTGSGSGTDDLGFSALPGGGRFNVGPFDKAGSHGYWWTATAATVEWSGNYAYYRTINNEYGNVWEYSGGTSTGFSVRCVQ
jgi:uncharacterized protein (TIGR02145 family)